MFLTGSKVGLGTPWRRIRDVFEPPLGLESCWGFAVSHASSTPFSRGPEVQANRGRSYHSLAVHCTAAEGAVRVSVKGNFFHWHFFASDMHFFERPSLRHLERKGCIIAFGPTAPTLFNQSACGFVVAFDCAFGFLATLLP